MWFHFIEGSKWLRGKIVRSVMNMNDDIPFQKSLVIRKLDLGSCEWSAHNEGETEILHSNNSPQLGGYYCFYLPLYIT